MASSSTVRAYKYARRGTPADVLRLDEHHSVPKRGEDDVLIKVKAAGLNPVDWKLMKFLPSPIAKHPAIAACDYSGTVLEASQSSGFAPGDEVFGIVHSTVKVKKGFGTLAEEIVAPALSCVKRPDHVEAIPAAGLSLVSLTAIALSRHVEWAYKKKDQPRVLVCGGSSSVGLQLVPILKHKGCLVAATCSQAKADMVKKRGAETTFDYKEGSLTERIHNYVEEHGTFDMILDCADAFDVWSTAAKTLSKEGYYVNVGVDLTQGVLPFLRRMISYFFLPTWLGGVPRKYKRLGEFVDRKNVAEMAELVDKGVITPVVDSEYAFEDTLAAFDRLKSNQATGKVIIRVQ